VFDSGDSASLPTDRVTLANSNIAVVISQKVRKQQKSQFTLTSATSLTIDLKEGISQVLVISQDITALSFTGESAYTGITEEVTLKVNQDGTGGWDITWPASIVWASGVAPVLAQDPAALSYYSFVTYDNGVTWLGSALTGDFVKVSDINAVGGVMGVNEFDLIFDGHLSGDQADGALYPELLDKEVIVVCSDQDSTRSLLYGRFTIPRTDVGDAHGLFSFGLNTSINFTFSYLNGEVNATGGSDNRIRMIYSREPQPDYPDIPEIERW
tara:strand:+ start:490 stop:1296 length:807 start_codon:yes stop_codon:yes gene_type:complete